MLPHCILLSLIHFLLSIVGMMVSIPAVTKFRNTLWTQNSAPRPVQFTQGQYRVGEKLSTHRGDNGDLNFML